MKKYLVLFIMLMAAVMLTSAAAEEKPTVYTSGDYKYVLLEDGTAEITDYTGKANELDIPAALNGHPVTSIGSHAFYWCSSLTYVTVPDGITVIGAEAFTQCSNLRHISLADSVAYIGDSAFSYCDALKSFTIPDSVDSLGANPFECCERLTTIIVSPEHPTLATIDGVLFHKVEKALVCYPYAFTDASYTVPYGIQKIGNRAFAFCHSLTSISIPETLTSIGVYSFGGCYKLPSLSIPDSVTFIDKNAFGNCPKLTVTVGRDSVAAQYCKDNEFAYTYPDANDWLLN